MLTPSVQGEARVVVFGDVMLDRNVSGGVERVSPEAPVPVVVVQAESAHLGGAANVAHNIVTLGCPVTLVGVRGDDEPGRELERLAQQRGIDTYLLVDAQRPTTTKSRVFAGRAQQVLRLDRESTQALEDRLERAVWRDLRAALATARAVVISDYAKGTVTDRLLRRLLRICRRRGLPTVVDPKRTDFRSYRGATVLTPNLREAALALGCPSLYPDESSAQAAATQLRAVSGAEHILLTRGERGMTLHGAEGTSHFRARARHVADVTGAGDTVVAMLAVSLAEGCPLATAVHRANVAAGLAVAKVGTQPVSRAEVEHSLHRRGSSQKILAPTDALRQVARWKDDGCHVVFTNGCFDILHAGHVYCLEEALRHGDRLLVAINSDRSVAALKGADRPIITVAHRAQLVAALECVDGVVIFDDDTPAALVDLLRPDVIVKGGDYHPDGIAGADRVRQDGGEVVIVPRYAELSTSQILEAVQRLAPVAVPVSAGAERNGQP